jgi:hypothetical protein
MEPGPERQSLGEYSVPNLFDIWCQQLCIKGGLMFKLFQVVTTTTRRSLLHLELSFSHLVTYFSLTSEKTPLLAP